MTEIRRQKPQHPHRPQPPHSLDLLDLLAVRTPRVSDGCNNSSARRRRLLCTAFAHTASEDKTQPENLCLAFGRRERQRERERETTWATGYSSPSWQQSCLWSSVFRLSSSVVKRAPTKGSGVSWDFSRILKQLAATWSCCIFFFSYSKRFSAAFLIGFRVWRTWSKVRGAILRVCYCCGSLHHQSLVTVEAWFDTRDCVVGATWLKLPSQCVDVIADNATGQRDCHSQHVTLLPVPWLCQRQWYWLTSVFSIRAINRLGGGWQNF